MKFGAFIVAALLLFSVVAVGCVTTSDLNKSNSPKDAANGIQATIAPIQTPDADEQPPALPSDDDSSASSIVDSDSLPSMPEGA